MGFFNNNYSDKTIYTKNAVIKYTNNRAIFQDVYLFLERAKNLAVIKDTVIKKNLKISLLDSVIN